MTQLTRKQQQLFNALSIVVGNAMYALTVVLFLMSSGLITGGATGIALAFNKVTGLSVSAILFVVNVVMLLLGIALWGIGMGAQESILKAAVTTMVPKSSRATGYGIFEFSFGVFWFLGSWLMGVLYDFSIPAMVFVSVAAQLVAVPLYYVSAKSSKGGE